MMERLIPTLEKIRNSTAKIGVIGLGYVGLPLVIEFCRAGFHTTGFDVDPEKVNILKEWLVFLVNHW